LNYTLDPLHAGVNAPPLPPGALPPGPPPPAAPPPAAPAPSPLQFSGPLPGPAAPPPGPLTGPLRRPGSSPGLLLRHRDSVPCPAPRLRLWKAATRC
jgi:hypothetical protein